MKKSLSILLSTAILSTATMAYDTILAQKVNNKFYSHMTQKTCANSKLFTTAENVMKMLRENKAFIFLDVRTDAEANVIKLSGENALHIPVESLFQAKNLNKLPTDKKIILVCHSGTRATMVAVGLKEIGFKNIQVLKGGLISLAVANNPKNAPLK
jgi:rhodanese-related sulfurtransferase